MMLITVTVTDEQAGVMLANTSITPHLSTHSEKFSRHRADKLRYPAHPNQGIKQVKANAIEFVAVQSGETNAMAYASGPFLGATRTFR
jgi:hypothetical protein